MANDSHPHSSIIMFKGTTSQFSLPDNGVQFHSAVYTTRNEFLSAKDAEYILFRLPISRRVTHSSDSSVQE